jgi:hypothetical protein
MKKNFLFPKACRKIGYFLFIPAIITGVVMRIFDFDLSKMLQVAMPAIMSDSFTEGNGFLSTVRNGIVDEILLTMLIIGGILAGFSRLPDEDEMTQAIRYESLVWALYVNFGIMLLAIWFFYGFIFLDVMIVNIFMVLMFFLLRFEIKLYGANKSDVHEK